MTNKDKRNSLLGLLLVSGVVFYIWKTRKPKAYAIESGDSGGGSGGGGFIGGGMPIIITPPAPTPTPAPAPAPKPTETFPTCKTGERYNPATRKCEPIVLDKPSDVSVKDVLKDVITRGGVTGGGNVVTPYDPCKANGYGGTYDPVTNTCKLSPFCNGGTLLLDSNGKQKGCEVKIPTGSGSGGVVVTTPDPCAPYGTYDPVTKSCKVKMPTGGDVLVGFSGKMPLTLDNILC